MTRLTKSDEEELRRLRSNMTFSAKVEGYRTDEEPEITWSVFLNTDIGEESLQRSLLAAADASSLANWVDVRMERTYEKPSVAGVVNISFNDDDTHYNTDTSQKITFEAPWPRNRVGDCIFDSLPQGCSAVTFQGIEVSKEDWQAIKSK